MLENTGYMERMVIQILIKYCINQAELISWLK